MCACVLEPQLLPFFFNFDKKQSWQYSIKVNLKLPISEWFVGREEIRAPLKTPAWEARNLAHNWLNLLTSCGPNLEAIGSNTIFCECWSGHRPKVVETFTFGRQSHTYTMISYIYDDPVFPIALINLTFWCGSYRFVTFCLVTFSNKALKATTSIFQLVLSLMNMKYLFVRGCTLPFLLLSTCKLLNQFTVTS